MERRGIVLDDREFEAAAPVLDRLLTYEIARYVFGVQAELRRRLEDDRVVHTARELLSGAATQQALLDAAAQRRAAKQEDLPASS
jgi:hypothetical protein